MTAAEEMKKARMMNDGLMRLVDDAVRKVSFSREELNRIDEVMKEPAGVIVVNSSEVRHFVEVRKFSLEPDDIVFVKVPHRSTMEQNR